MEKELIEEIAKKDSSFNEAIFKSYIDNMFVKIHTAIMFDELENVKHFMTDELFQELKAKQKLLENQNLRQMYDEINVKSTEVIDFSETKDEYKIKVKLISRYMDYYLKRDTGDYSHGNNQSRVERVNDLILKKKKTFLTQKTVRKCPGCGASISVNTKGVCEYCGTIYNLEDYQYILESITTQ